jgi:hypothetical protein
VLRLLLALTLGVVARDRGTAAESDLYGGHPGCPNNFKGPQGTIYGIRLYLVDKSASPLWSAGRYGPAVGELDCIGVVIERWGSGAIQFHFGSFYRIGHSHLEPATTSRSSSTISA